MTMNRKIIFSLLAASALTIALAGCAPESGKQAATSLSPQAASSQSPLPAESEASLTYYKANDEGTKIIPVSMKVKAKDRTAKTALEEMIRTDRKSKGSTGESLFIAMTVDTLTEFPNIHDVVIRVEGKSPKFQMDMTRPFKRDESYIQMEKK